MNFQSLIISNTPLYRPLAALAAERRIVLFAGLPGVGKSLFLQQMALLAHEAERTVHLRQWDVTRTAFETDAILARYPEVDGITHAAIRKGVGLWARKAIQHWHAVHTTPEHILIGEVPLIGNRLIELVQPLDDDVEALLAGEQTTFVLPVPTQEVRQVIESARARTMANPQHAKEKADASPYVLQRLWTELYQVAQELQLVVGQANAASSQRYDPAIYAAVYQHLLQHRHCRTLSVDQVLPKVGSVYTLPIRVQEMVASGDEVAAQMRLVERQWDSLELERAVAAWYRFD
ncbi:MAG: hypothetical protein KDE31_22470 [Caldilineaceae bacterium]|nr:hypothetical protein [Caldilineaceae bacterium]